ncbi:hypothetical protein FB474_3604 [Oryzihumus leptocrescens]|uniref:Uncharacterized protein n=1 Tax=Oryzihumus leptocrescens TaxID=297536 RepID=A0A542Z921_9MICO|nr:hypothetical protein FB474_3604 [Oryzihumus leptocrescens]
MEMPRAVSTSRQPSRASDSTPPSRSRMNTIGATTAVSAA